MNDGHPEYQPGQDGRAPRRGKSGRWQIVLLALLFVAPVAASYFTYYVIRPGGRTNFGTLIDPQRPMPALVATDLNGDPVGLMHLKGQWLLISVAGGACGAECQHNLYLQRQLRETLGKNMRRLDWVWLVDDDAPVPDAIKPGLHDATVLRVPERKLAAWLAPAPGHRLVEHLYLVDPHGNWMMRFPADLDQAGALKAKDDLSRLMRASAGWDKAGRVQDQDG